MTTKSIHNFQEVTELKAQVIQQLFRLLDCLFSGRKIKRMPYEYRIGNHGSVSVRISDGNYFNHETGEGGDVFTLIQHTLKTDFKGAVLFARKFIGNVPLAPVSTTDNLQKKIDNRKALQRGKAIAMIKRSICIEKTLAETYLREKRAIAIEQLPTSLRFIEHAYNFTAKGFYPAMVASICDVEGEIIASHCTFLSPITGDKLQGDDIKSRLIFGACRGGAIRLAQATDKLAVCEGIEDGLSIMQCSPDWPVWATGGTSGLRSVQIPKHVREVMICADRDEAGIQAAKDLSARLVSEGKKVRIAMPPEGIKDFNDLLRQGDKHAK